VARDCFHPWTFHNAGTRYDRLDYNKPYLDRIPHSLHDFLSAIQNLNFKDQRKSNSSKIPYYTVLFFGLIHGLGFSNYLQSLLGKESSIFTPLLAFNIGLEFGQLIIVSLILILTSTLNSFTRIKRIHYVYVISGIIIGLVVPMLVERIP